MAAVDRISEVPEPILHHILSFLSHKQAIQTSALSRTWRHVGPTRPKIELREICFQNSGRASLLSVLDKTLERYNHQNLSVHEFILEMFESNSWYLDHQQLTTDPEFTTTDDQPLFKSLKRLSLTNVYIKDETLEKIMRSCSLMEYLLLSDCKGLKIISATIFKAEFLTELHLAGCSFPRENLMFTAPSSNELILIKRLKTLSLKRVNISEKTLEKIMCSCPLIQRLLLTDCLGLTNLQLIKNNNNNLKHFSCSFYQVVSQSIEIDAPAIETIRIVNCPNWYGHDKYSFPRLKTLCLNNVKLSAEFFESFSSNFPSLEDLQLKHCYGFPEIQLTACSIKRLVLMSGSLKPIKAIIYAPCIYYFKFFGHNLPQLIFTSESVSGEWQSHLEVWPTRTQPDNKDLNLLWFVQLSKLLNSLRESQIFLVVILDRFTNLKFEDTNDTGFCNPVPLEGVRVKGYHDSSSCPDVLKGLFLICRPRYISMDLGFFDPVNGLKKEKDKLAEFMTFKTIRNEGEMSRGYLWERELEDISMQFWDGNSQEWHTSFPVLSSPTLKIRFLVKWID